LRVRYDHRREKANRLFPQISDIKSVTTGAIKVAFYPPTFDSVRYVIRDPRIKVEAGELETGFCYP
jgi:hypothetical protein